jgi:hypothetical protein
MLKNIQQGVEPVTTSAEKPFPAAALRIWRGKPDGSMIGPVTRADQRIDPPVARLGPEGKPSWPSPNRPWHRRAMGHIYAEQLVSGA